MDRLLPHDKLFLRGPFLQDHVLRLGAPCTYGTPRRNGQGLHSPALRARSDELEAVRNCLATALQGEPAARAIQEPVGVEVL